MSLFFYLREKNIHFNEDDESGVYHANGVMVNTPFYLNGDNSSKLFKLSLLFFKGANMKILMILIALLLLINFGLIIYIIKSRKTSGKIIFDFTGTSDKPIQIIFKKTVPQMMYKKYIKLRVFIREDNNDYNEEKGFYSKKYYIGGTRNGKGTGKEKQ